MTMLGETARVEQGGSFPRSEQTWPMPVALRRVLV
jgi:hypothetical protein